MSHVLSAVAWPYTNGPRHIGHVAGFGVPSDVFSRYMRMAGHDVLMVSGTDEHGTPILVLAEQEGLTPQALVDKYNAVIAQDLTDLGLSYDLFTRTTTLNHYAVVQEMFRQVHANGYLIEQTQLVAISPSTGRTLPDRYIQGTCPICGFPEARGDQCDNCGNQLDPIDLIDPRSKINGEVPQFSESAHFFLDLPALAGALGEWLDGREASGTWRPNVIKFSRNLLRDLRPRAMTRDIDWGIPIPIEGWVDNPGKRLYVWFDAVIGYLSASIEWARRQGAPDRWREWWNAADARTYYFQGKDNITFHAQIWPAELLAYAGKGDKGGEPGEYGVLNLPTEVVASEFMTLEGKQFSTSRGHVIYVQDVVARYGPDPIRYFICAAGPENQDSDFSWKEFVQRNNSELVAGWGNFVQRTATMVAKSFGEVPRPDATEPVDDELLAAVEAGFATVGGLLERQRQKAALAEVMRLVGEANAYVSRTEPFKLKGEHQRERLATVLHTLVQVVSDLNTMMSPFLPHSANRVHAVIGGQGELMPMPRLEVVRDLDDDSRSYPVITGDYRATPRWERRPVEVGAPVAKPTGVFTKFDADQVVADEQARLAAGDDTDKADAAPTS
ncbi:MAG: methionine--tRNA ligase [Terracoccus sp.]